MIEITDKNRFAKVIADSIAKVEMTTTNPQTKKRWINAVAKATVEIEQNGIFMTWQEENHSLADLEPEEQPNLHGERSLPVPRVRRRSGVFPPGGGSAGSSVYGSGKDGERGNETRRTDLSETDNDVQSRKSRRNQNQLNTKGLGMLGTFLSLSFHLKTKWRFNITDNTTTQTKKQKDDQNNSADVPTMTEDEMKKFISTLANTQEIQGDYVFNGFLFFFQTINEAIRRSQVEAQNLMLHLQEHVFHKLMWESFWAFDAHRKKAHLIFEKTEPFVEYEAIVDLSETELEDLALPLSTLLENPNLPKSIKNALQDNLSTAYINIHTPENVLANLKEIKQFEEARNAEEN